MRGFRTGIVRGVSLVVGLSALACDAESRACREQMASAQAIVAKVDGKSATSVQESLTAVERAHATCDQAKLGAEREQLLKAKHELTAQRDLLEARARRKKRVAPSKEELAQLAKTGDPSCPKGQAYKPRESPKEIRCTGPQLVDMTLPALKDYYEPRRFKVTTSESPAELRAELGSEKYVFAFDEPNGGSPRCVKAYAVRGMSWQELTSRLTGVAPDKLKLNAPVQTGSRELPLEVEHPDDQPTITLGACASTP